MALTFYNYGRDSQCVFFSLQESGQITNTPLSLDTTKHSRYITPPCCTSKSKNTPSRAYSALMCFDASSRFQCPSMSFLSPWHQFFPKNSVCNGLTRFGSATDRQPYKPIRTRARRQDWVMESRESCNGRTRVSMWFSRDLLDFLFTSFSGLLQVG